MFGRLRRLGNIQLSAPDIEVTISEAGEHIKFYKPPYTGSYGSVLTVNQVVLYHRVYAPVDKWEPYPDMPESAEYNAPCESLAQVIIGGVPIWQNSRYFRKPVSCGNDKKRGSVIVELPYAETEVIRILKEGLGFSRVPRRNKKNKSK